jgi:hypothetical protein
MIASPKSTRHRVQARFRCQRRGDEIFPWIQAKWPLMTTIGLETGQSKHFNGWTETSDERAVSIHEIHCREVEATKGCISEMIVQRTRAAENQISLTFT